MNLAVTYFSDVLCVWAYVAEIRLDELRRNLGDRIDVDYRFVPVFSNTAAKIGGGWAERGSWEGYAGHVREVVGRFDHVEIHEDTWARVQPASSFGAHAFVKAAALAARAGEIEAAPVAAYEGRTPTEELLRRLRRAFFHDGADVARLDVQRRIAETVHVPFEPLRARLEDGRAFAALLADYAEAAHLQVTGSPTFVLDNGRQKLYGNVGYRIVEANVQELLRDRGDSASWC
jgi:predicted DsbA family dithiol-disulfide isomerase